MEDKKNLSISIPKPCHEDWKKMTPNERGAFCGKCAKTVVDFTTKTTKEIQDFFLIRSDKKTCGRFLSTQLDDSPKQIDLLIPLHLIPKNLSFSKAFAFAIFLTFGTTLFSCSTQKGEVVGKIAATDTAEQIKSFNDPSPDDTTFNSEREIINGKVVGTNCSSFKGDVDIRQTLGEVEVPVDTTKEQPDTLKNYNSKTGKIKIRK